nr:MAG TPA: hypothetical protein [Caudoviricetes sp.]
MNTLVATQLSAINYIILCFYYTLFKRVCQ